MPATTRIVFLCILLSSAAYLYSQGGAYGTMLGTVIDNSGAVLANPRSKQTTNQQTYRLDQELGRLGKVFFRYTTATYDNDNVNESITTLYGIGVFNEKAESCMISHTKEFGPRIINNFRFGRLEPIAIQGGNPITAAQVSALNISGLYPVG